VGKVREVGVGENGEGKDIYIWDKDVRNKGATLRVCKSQPQTRGELNTIDYGSPVSEYSLCLRGQRNTIAYGFPVSRYSLCPRAWRVHSLSQINHGPDKPSLSSQLRSLYHVVVTQTCPVHVLTPIILPCSPSSLYASEQRRPLGIPLTVTSSRDWTTARLLSTSASTSVQSHAGPLRHWVAGILMSLYRAPASRKFNALLRLTWIRT